MPSTRAVSAATRATRTAASSRSVRSPVGPGAAGSVWVRSMCGSCAEGAAARAVEPGPPQCRGSLVGGTLGLLALVEGVGVGVVGLGQVGRLGEGVGQGAHGRGGAAEAGAAQKNKGRRAPRARQRARAV